MPRHTPRPKLVMFGIDGFGPELWDELRQKNKIPHLEHLAGQGGWSKLDSTIPPTTLPAWTSIMTGAPPARHGINDFTVRQGYKIRFVGAESRRLPTLFEHLEKHGLDVGTAWFPATYPPVPLGGYQISGWDSPVTHRGDSSFVHPSFLHEQMLSRFGDDHLSFDPIDEFASENDWHHNAAARLVESVEKKAEMARWLLENRPVDVAAFYFGETDTVAHHFWAFHDPNSPRRPALVSPQLSSAVADVYAAVDRAVAEVHSACPEGTKIVVVSDHGSAGAGRRVVYLNRILEKAGLLRFNKRYAPLPTELIRNTAPRLIPRSLRRHLFRFAGGLAPGFVESKTRLGAIDWTRTSAFSEEIPYAPAVWLNLQGRDPEGIVAEANAERIIKRVQEALGQAVTEQGEPIVRRVYPARDVHRGEYEHLFPDLIVELETEDGYQPICQSSRGHPGPVSRQLPPKEWLGRKGRSLPGCHSPKGMIIADSPDAPLFKTPQQKPALWHVAGNIAHMLDIPPASWFEATGSPSLSLKKDDATPPALYSGMGYTKAQEQIIAERLKKLGYLDE